MKKSKLSKKTVAAIISVAVAAVIITALLIVNIFFPLKYFTAYLVGRKRSPQGALYFHVLDVGHADCAIAELPDGKTMLIDGGDGSYTTTLKILTQLNRLDIDYIDYLVCTSVKAEHCGGLAEIISNKTVGEIFYPYSTNRYITREFAAFMSAAASSGARLTVGEYGAGAVSGDFYFTYLSPDVHTAPGGEYQAMNSSPTAANIDAASAILWLEFAGRGMLYAGDAPAATLEALADEYEQLSQIEGDGYFEYCGHAIDFSRCTLYKAAGHGGEGYASAKLSDLLSPDVSVISVGEGNGEGCPSLEAMADLLAHGQLYITMYRGDITCTVSQNRELSVSAARS